MLSSYERMIATRYLRPIKGEGFIFIVSMISLIGIAIGVAALIAVMSVMNGFRGELLDRILGVNGHMLVQGYDGRLDEWERLRKLTEQAPGVKLVTPLIQQQLMASRRNLSAGVIVRGQVPADVRNHPLVAKNIVEGSLDDFQDGEPVIAIGSKLAGQLLARVGDSISLISPEGQVTPFGVTPRIASYRVVAIFEVGVFDYDNAFILMPMETAQTYFRMGSSVSGLEVVLDNPDRIDATINALTPVVQPYGAIVDWRSLNRSLFEALEVERVVMFWILSIIIVVAVFNIVSSLIMLVRAKSKDIAILRTMGASRASVMRVFMLAGTSIGALGTAAGLVLGFLLLEFRTQIVQGASNLFGIALWNPEVRFLSEMPSKVDPMEVLATVGISLLLTVLATLYPSWRAANTDPVQVLRYE